MRARDNPFATAHLERLAFRFPPGLDWDTFLARLAASHYRGAIIGPEGSGKTTLLEELARRLRGIGFKPFIIRLNCENHRTSTQVWRTLAESAGPRALVLIDGAEQLNRWQWRRLETVTADLGGLIVTAHRATRLPTLMECRTSPELLRALVDELIGSAGSVESEFFDQLFKQHGGNLRLTLLELYDRCAAREIPASGHFDHLSPDGMANRSGR